MSNNLHLLFQLAAKFYYKKYRDKGGTLDELAKNLGITPTYLSAVINGSRVASLDLQNQIAQIFHGPYDKFISAGRQISQGKDPLEKEESDPDQSVESIIAQLTHLVMDHKRIANELKLSELKFKDISLTSGDIIFEIDETLSITFVSGKVKEITRLSPQQLIGKNVFTFLDEIEWRNIAPLVETSIQTRSIFDSIVRINRNGKTLYRHCIAKPIFSIKNDRFIGFRGTYRDITKRKNLEKNLLNQAWLFQGAIDAIEEYAIIITDQGDKIIRWNKAYQQIMGYPLEILEQRSLKACFAFLKDKLKKPDVFFKGIKEMLSSREQTIHYFEMKNGKTIKRRVDPIYRDGVLAGRLTFLTDVTDTPNQ